MSESSSKALPTPESDPVEQYKIRFSAYESFAKRIESVLKVALEKDEVVTQDVTSRAKDPDSFARKLEEDEGKYEDPFAQVTDLSGVRVIVYYPSEVDRVAKIVEENFVVHERVDKRKTTDPTQFGYASLHYVIGMTPDRLKLVDFKEYAGLKCEIQIRTVLQHAWAEIEHDTAYKSTAAVPVEMRRSFAGLAALIELADKEFETLRNEGKEIGEKVDQQIKVGELVAQIDAESLLAYLKQKEVKGQPLYDASMTRHACSYIVSECIETGVLTLEDLDKAIEGTPLDRIGEWYKEWRRAGGAWGYIRPMNSLTAIRAVLMYTHPEAFLNYVKTNRDWGQYPGVLRFYEQINRIVR